jgi:hypothetical protein
MNPGSAYFMELGFNGNGNLDQAVTIDPNNCNDSISFNDPPAPPSFAEFEKPLGSGISSWPANAQYIWQKACTLKDPLAAYVQNVANRDEFAWITHTFTHEDLDNVTFYDANNELGFNVKHANILGLDQAKRWSSKSMIPPAITGLHNGDALSAIVNNGIMNAVGDNTRPALVNQQNPHWPVISTKAANGYDGFIIIPRWATRIYFDSYRSLGTLLTLDRICNKIFMSGRHYRPVRQERIRHLHLSWRLKNKCTLARYLH